MKTEIAESKPLHIGWAQTDITPDQPVQLDGQHYARISEGVLDPVTATALALSSGKEPASAVILVSSDLVTASDSLRDAVRKRVAAALPELSSDCVILNATHTHTAPTARLESDAQKLYGASIVKDEIELPVMNPADYIDWAAERIADAVIEAWRARGPGAVAFGLGHAVVGRNRRMTYNDGVSRMYGDTSTDDFRHVEGYEDHSVNLLATWNADGTLTGLVVNVPCPAQVTETLFEISADYWHDTRVELRRRFGEKLFVLPQCSVAGDQSPHVLWDKTAEERMLRLSGRTLRQQIAVRIADAVDGILPHIAAERKDDPVLLHRSESVALARRRLSEADVREALAAAEPHRLEYERLMRELETHPEQREERRWYVPITGAYRQWRFFSNVKFRFDLERSRPRLPVEVHVFRVGDVAIATNPFEYFLDFGVRIKTRSPAVQTFLVQLAGAGSYVPTERALAAKGYGAAPAGTPVGPEGGSELAEATLTLLDDLWK